MSSLKMKYYERKFIFNLIIPFMFLIVSVIPVKLNAQIAKHIMIVPSKKTIEPSTRIKLEGLTEKLKDALNSYYIISFKAEVISYEMYEKLQKVQSKAVSEKGQTPIHYYVVINLKEENTLLKCTVSVVLNNNKVAFKFDVSDEMTSKYPLVQKIINNLVINIEKNIRVVILDFVTLGGDKGKQDQFKRTLPNMLTEGLELSNSLVVLSEENEIRKRLIASTDSTKAVSNEISNLEFGKMLHANYLIAGDYGVLEGELRIHARLVSIETGEILVAKGITVESVEYNIIEKEMATLASKIREAIEYDFREHAQRKRYIAISGVPPIPGTKENRATLLEIIRTTSRKLKSIKIENLKVKEDMAMVNEFITEKQDRWYMSSKLEVDSLITINLDRTERDQLELTIDNFDSQNPHKLDSIFKTASPADIDSKLNEIITESIEKKWIKADTKIKNWERIKYGGLYESFAFRYQVGCSIRSDPELFLDTGGGLMIDLGFVWPPRYSKWQVEPVHLRLDFLGETDDWDRTVIGTDLFSTLIYRFNPHYEYNFYMGASIGFLGVLRKAPGDYNIDMKPGFGLVCGFEKTLISSRKINVRIEYARTFTALPPMTIDDERFEGGKPGGFYITISVDFDLFS